MCKAALIMSHKDVFGREYGSFELLIKSSTLFGGPVTMFFQQSAIWFDGT